MIESAAAQWKPRKVRKPPRIFSLLDQTKLSILTKATARKPAQARGNQKMMAYKRQSNSESPMKASFFQNRKFDRRPVADTI